MQKFKLKPIATLALASALVVAPMTAQAASYKDVPSNHWAQKHISKLGDLRIVQGYPDGSFKPARSVTYCEILELLKGIQNPSPQDITRAISNYAKVSDEYKVPSWAKAAVCVALENKVITEANLKAAYEHGYITVSGKGEKYPSRELVLVYYAKALGIQPKADTSNIKVKDLNAIGKTPTSLTGNVDIKGLYAAMIDTTIFHESGTGDVFNPAGPLRREQMAKITDLSYEYKNKMKQTQSYEGEVYFVENLNGTPTFAIKDKAGKAIAFELLNDTKINLNGKAANKDAITVGSQVKVSAYSTNSGITSLRAVTVDVIGVDTEGVGIVKGIKNDEITIDYTTKKDTYVDSKFKAEKNATFKVTKDSTIYRLGQKSEIKYIASSDMVVFTVKNGVIKDLQVYPYSGTVTGELVDYDYGTRFQSKRNITLKLDDGKNHKFFVNDDKAANELFEVVRGLSKGAPVTLNTHYQDVVSSKVATQDLEGLYNGIEIDRNDNAKIYLKTTNGLRNYVLSKTISFRNEKSIASTRYSPSDVRAELSRYGNEKEQFKTYIRLRLSGGVVDEVSVLRKLVNENEELRIINTEKLPYTQAGVGWAQNSWNGYTAYNIKDYASPTKAIKLPTGIQVENNDVERVDEALRFGRLYLKYDRYTASDGDVGDNFRLVDAYRGREIKCYPSLTSGLK